MSIRNRFAVAAAILTVALSGCWSQNDEVTFRKNGDIMFKSDVTITDREIPLADARSSSMEYLAYLSDGGWDIRYKWTSEKQPYRMTVMGDGNIRNIVKETDFYVIRQVREGIYEVRFPVPDTPGSERNMVFSCGLMEDCAQVVDRNGEVVKSIDRVDPGSVYWIRF